jgi:hypothetical protein
VARPGSARCSMRSQDGRGGSSSRHAAQLAVLAMWRLPRAVTGSLSARCCRPPLVLPLAVVTVHCITSPTVRSMRIRHIKGSDWEAAVATSGIQELTEGAGLLPAGGTPAAGGGSGSELKA